MVSKTIGRSMKGIILAGGYGTRLYPLTYVVSKQLQAVYNKPMVYYPLTTLMLSGIRDILIITTLDSQHLFQCLLGDGSKYGCNFSYLVQKEPKGIAEAFFLARSFIGSDKVALILGDNLFYGVDCTDRFRDFSSLKEGAMIHACKVKNSKRYGVVVFDSNSKVVSIEEKPKYPKSNYAVTGIYFYDNQVLDIVSELTPSARGELEITDVNLAYLRKNQLIVSLLDEHTVWLDAGTFSDLMKASNFVETIEVRQKILIGSPEYTAYQMGYIHQEAYQKLIASFQGNEYGLALSSQLDYL